jgi:hypothetical protein
VGAESRAKGRKPRWNDYFKNFINFKNKIPILKKFRAGFFKGGSLKCSGVLGAAGPFRKWVGSGGRAKPFAHP